MGYAAVLGDLPAEAWWLLLANIFWAVAYDTEYAMVDRDDDVRIGIRTAAITLGKYDVAAVMVCYGATLAVLAGIGMHRDMGAPYYAGLGGAAVLMGYHYRLIRSRERDLCFKAFNQNNWVGAAIFAGIAADFALKRGIPWT
jgi:4-hydroxybenzoate polyprenyltransferase